VEAQALQPGFARQVGQRPAGVDARAQQRGHRRLLRRRDGLAGYGIFEQIGIQRQPERVQYQPGRFVIGVDGAVAKAEPGGIELPRHVLHQFEQGHGSAARFSSRRR